MRLGREIHQMFSLVTNVLVCTIEKPQQLGTQ